MSLNSRLAFSNLSVLSCGMALLVSVATLSSEKSLADIVAGDVGVFTYAEPREPLTVWFPSTSNSGAGGPSCVIGVPAALGIASVEQDCLWGLYRHNNYPYAFFESFTYYACDNASCDVGKATVYGTTSHSYIVAGLDLVLETEQNTAQIWVAASGDYVPSCCTRPSFSYSLETQPLHGTATAPTATASGTYKPNDGYVGSDYFSYRAYDPLSPFAGSGVVAVRVKAPKSIPIAANLSLQATQTQTLTWKPSVFDGDNGPQPLSCRIGIAPTGGSATIASDCSGGTYQSSLGQFGTTDHFTYIANDGVNDSTPATVLVTVRGANQVPVANDVSTDVTAGYTGTWKPSVSDPDSGPKPLTCRIVTPPSQGNASVLSDCTGGSYLPNAGFYGQDSFTYLANDGAADSNVATVNIKVMAAPVAADISVAGQTGALIIWTPSVYDPDNGPLPLTCQIISSPTYGTASVSGGCEAGFYQSEPGFVGIDRFVYRAYDGSRVADATVTVAITDGTADQICIQNNPISQFTQAGMDGTITITFTGNITTHTNKVVKLCPGTTLKYQASSTKGPVICKVKNNTTRGSGSLKINDHLKCTDKPAGTDKVHFKVKSGVSK